MLMPGVAGLDGTRIVVLLNPAPIESAHRSLVPRSPALEARVGRFPDLKRERDKDRARNEKDQHGQEGVAFHADTELAPTAQKRMRYFCVLRGRTRNFPKRAMTIQGSCPTHSSPLGISYGLLGALSHRSAALIASAIARIP